MLGQICLYLFDNDSQRMTLLFEKQSVQPGHLFRPCCHAVLWVSFERISGNRTIKRLNRRKNTSNKLKNNNSATDTATTSLSKRYIIYFARRIRTSYLYTTNVNDKRS